MRIVRITGQGFQGVTLATTARIVMSAKQSPAAT
jgi:hypothetical protein